MQNYAPVTTVKRPLVLSIFIPIIAAKTLQHLRISTHYYVNNQSGDQISTFNLLRCGKWEIKQILTRICQYDLVGNKIIMQT